MSIPASYGRTIRYLRISLTDRCNLRCRYCMPAGRVPWLPAERLLSPDELERVVRAAAAAGVRKVRLTGGEPLVRPGVVDLIARLRRIPGLAEIAMTTNGTLLAPSAAALRRAGLDRLNVSLDTLRPDRFATLTRGGALADVLAGLEAAAAAGFPIKLNTVAMRGVNEDELADLARFGLERGWEVRFIEYMPIGCGAADWRRRFLPAEEIARRLEEALGPLEAVEDGGSDPASRYRVAGGAACVGIIASISRPFCRGCDRLRLTADGRVRSCLLREGEVDLRPLLRPASPSVPGPRHGPAAPGTPAGDTDAAIVAALCRAAGLKPEWHGITPDGWGAGVPQAAMSEIGG